MIVMHSKIPGGNVSQREPPAGDNDPDDIAEEGEDPGVWLVDQLPAERPDGIARHSERGIPHGMVMINRQQMIPASM